jgi:hypothetical protein
MIATVLVPPIPFAAVDSKGEEKQAADVDDTEMMDV